jgi:hypothetical protein
VEYPSRGMDPDTDRHAHLCDLLTSSI